MGGGPWLVIYGLTLCFALLWLAAKQYTTAHRLDDCYLGLKLSNKSLNSRGDTVYAAAP